LRPQILKINCRLPNLHFSVKKNVKLHETQIKIVVFGFEANCDETSKIFNFKNRRHNIQHFDTQHNDFQHNIM